MPYLSASVVAQNKANFRSCADQEIGVPRGPSVRNKANSGRSFKFEVSSFKLEKQMVGTSNFTLYTSHSAEGCSCDTKPIGRGVSSGKCQVSSEERRARGSSHFKSETSNRAEPIMRNKANSWDWVGRLTLPGSIGYNDTHADGFLFGRGDAAGWGARKGWRESP